MKVEKQVEKFVRAHRARLKNEIDFVVGVSRGGLIPAVLIAVRLNKPLVAVYIDKKDKVYLDRKPWLSGKRILLVDDIVRTGKTFRKMLALLKKSGAREIKSFTLFCLKSSGLRPTWTTIISRDKKMPWDF